MGKKLKNKDIDLLISCKQKKEPSKFSGVWKYALFPGGMLIIVIALTLYFTLSGNRLNQETKDLQEQSAKVQEQISKDPNLEKYNSLQKAKSDTTTLQKLRKDIDSYPQLDQSTFDKIVVAEDVDVDVTSFSYSRDSQVVTLQIEANNVSSTEKFVRRLKTSNLFAKVDYAGYSRSEKVSEDTSAAADTTDTEKDTTKKDDTASESQELLELLNQLKKEQTTNTEKTQKTTSVYTATILCTLK